MIHFPRSKFDRVIEMPLATLQNHNITGGGQTLMAVMENGVGKAMLHDGTASKPIIGYSVMKAAPETGMATAQTFRPTSDNLTGTLRYTPTGTKTAFDLTTNAAVVVSTTASAGQIGITGGVNVVFDSSMVGHNISVVYNFSPTLQQLRAIQGDVEPGGNVSLALSSVGVMKSGILYTSHFEANELWFNFDDTAYWLTVTATAGSVGIGQSTTPKVPNAQLLNAPSGDIPFVGFSFSC